LNGKRWQISDLEISMLGFSFSPELVALMRTVLDDAMLQVPSSVSNATTKVFLAESILKAASQGHTSYNELFAAATVQVQTITSMLP
jgi:hypothetical protein